MRVTITSMLAAVAALAATAASFASAENTCGVGITLSAPKRVVAGKKFTAKASIRRTGSAATVEGLYFQLQLPDYLQPRGGRASAFAFTGHETVIDGPFLYFRALRLPARKTLRLKMVIGVPTCQAAGPVALQGMAYRLEGDDNVVCTTTASPVTTTVALKRTVASSKHAIQGTCTPPTPVPDPFALIGTNTRCIEAQLLDTFDPANNDGRRALATEAEEAETEGESAPPDADLQQLVSTASPAELQCWTCCGAHLRLAPEEPYYFNLDSLGR